MMKKSEAKPGSKPKKATRETKEVKSRKVVSRKSATGEKKVSRKVAIAKTLPGEEEISRKAYEIYKERITRGENGNPTDDWHKAAEILRNS